MKLFSLPDGTVDRKDRAQWLSCPFDLAFGAPTADTASAETTWHVPARGTTWHVPARGTTWHVPARAATWHPPAR